MNQINSRTLFLLTIIIFSILYFFSFRNTIPPAPSCTIIAAPHTAAFHTIYMQSIMHPDDIQVTNTSRLCLPLPSEEAIAACAGQHLVLPVVSNKGILDPNDLDFTNFPNGPQRPHFHYAPATRLSPLVTILTAFHDTPRIFLREAKRSVFGQSLQRFQWIIINDASTDADALEGLDAIRKEAETEPRILIVDLAVNKGLPGARNEGLKHARGKYVLLLDADDFIENTYLEKAVWFLETEPEFTLCNAWSVGFGHKHFLWPRGFQDGDLNRFENMITVATVMRTDVLLEIGGFDENLLGGMEDWDLWMRFANNGHWGYTLPEYHFWYRVSPPGKWSSISNATNFAKHMERQQAKYSNVYVKGVPKINRLEQEKYENTPPPGDLVTTLANPLLRCRLHILVLIPYMEVGGADQFNFNFLYRMVEKGWEVTIVCDKTANNVLYSMFSRLTPDIFVMPRFLPSSDQPRFIAYIIESRKPDLVFISNSERAYHYLPYLRAFAPEATIVDYVHSETPDWKSGGYARYSAAEEPWLDRSLFASKHLEEYVIDLGHNPNKTSTVYIGVDSQRFQRNEVSRKAIRSKLSLSDDTLLIVYIARLESEKGPDVFAQTVQLLHKDGLDFMAVSIGGGSLYDELNSTIIKHGLTQKVKLLGTTPYEEVLHWISAADVSFLPSKVEGISLALMEAMSTGVTCVAARVGGQPELITDEVGFLVVPGSPYEAEQYAEILAGLIRDPAKARALGQASKQRILDHFDSVNTITNLQKEFCLASKVHHHSKHLFNNVGMQRMGIEYASLSIEYERTSDELLSVWRELQFTQSKISMQSNMGQALAAKHTPAPFNGKDITPETLLPTIKFDSLRSVTSIMDERLVDRSMKINLRGYDEQYMRPRPRCIIDNFNYNEFLGRYNLGVDSWEPEVPFRYTQDNYIAELSNVYLSPGDSGTVFDWDRAFPLELGVIPMFKRPVEWQKTCVVEKYSKLATIVQLYSSYAHFLSHHLPRLGMLWDLVQSDPEINILVPFMGNSVVDDVLVDLLNITKSRLVYYRYGEGWNPCKTYFAEKLYLPNPAVTDNPSRELLERMYHMVAPALRDRCRPREQAIVYMSREDARSRKVINEQEFLDQLQETFPNEHIVRWSYEKSFLGTVCLMHRARIVIGMHGQTMAPIVFANNKTTSVIELLHSRPWLHYWNVATAKQMDYWMVPIMEASHESQSITLPIDKLIKTVEEVLKKKQQNANKHDEY